MIKKLLFFSYLLFSLIIAVNAEWSLDWTDEPGFEENGIDPDRGPRGTEFNFRIRFNTEDPAIYPVWVKLFIDLDGDGRFERAEIFDLEPSPDDRNIWTSSLRIGTEVTGAAHMAYYFQAFAGGKIRTSMLVFGPIIEGIGNSFVIEGSGWFIKEALVPMEVKTMGQNEEIFLINTSGTPLSIKLSIPVDTTSPFHPADDINTIEPDAYVMSALVTDPETEKVGESDFNQSGSDDVITVEPKPVKSPFFRIGNRSEGDNILPGESVSIWLQLRAPATASGENALDKQWVYIKVEVFPAE